MSRVSASGARALLAGVLSFVAGVVDASPPLKEVTPTPVSERTMRVAVLPRPPRMRVRPPRHCPHLQRGLQPFDPSWISPDGVATIPAGTKALVRGNREIPADLLIRQLVVPAGSELIFADRRATYRVRDVRVAGALRIGSAECRVQSRVEFIFDTEENVADPGVREQIHGREGLGILVEPGGVLEAFGRLHQPTWTRLAASTAAGSRIVRLADAVDWRPGQEVVVVTSARRDYPFQDENEVRTIRALRGRTMLVLDRPLEHLHYGGREYQVEVGLLSRNLVFRTAPSVLEAAPSFGGHIMAHAAQMRVSGVELRGLGQRNFLGRYPLHFHHLGDVAGRSYFTDSSIRDSNWRCAVVHRTDRAVVSRNVAYNAFGHCYYLEDGVEQGNEISFNLAAGIKIMGPVDQASLDEFGLPFQQGFTLRASSDFVNPADRAAAGFYFANGNNRIVGNAASGGFAGYSFPNLPEAFGGGPAPPWQVPVSHFDGNTAHSAGYLWPDSGCVYVGGVLRLVDDGGGPTLEYQSGRPQGGSFLRQQQDVFSNTKTFLCESGLVHWGNEPRVVNLEAWDVGLMAQLFGNATVRSALVAGHTGNTENLDFRPRNWYQRGFRFYDTGTLTLMRGVVFRGFHRDPLAGPGLRDDSCAMVSIVHSDQYTPQRMTATGDFFFADVDDALRFCHDDPGTLSSRNFNLNDTDGSATRRAGDLLPPGPRIVGSGYLDIWRFNDGCVRNDDWGLWVCPQRGTQNVASIATLPNAGVRVAMFDLQGNPLGENWYSDTHYAEAQISGPSGTRWHHAFPGGVPPSFEVHAKQVPDGSFVVYSFSLPSGASCRIESAEWTAVADLATLVASSGAVYTTSLGICYVRIPPAHRGYFEAAGLSLPYPTWPYWPTQSTFTIRTE